MIPKPDKCRNCPLFNVTSNAFVPIVDVGTTELIVGEAPGEEEELRGLPFIGGAGRWLDGMLRAAKQSRAQFCVANTMLCRPPNNLYPTDPGSPIAPDVAAAGVEYCWNTWVRPFIDSRRWTRIIALGNKALRALTGREGIELWRGSPLPLAWRPDRPVVIPTYHPAYLMRQPEQTSVAVHDLRKQPTIPPEDYQLFATPDELAAFDAKAFAFDLEWDINGNISICGLSDRMYRAIVVPWDAAYIPHLRRIFEGAEELIGHNIITADLPHLERMGWRIRARLWDTLLMQHLVQPDMRHGLAFVASIFTNKPYWKGYGGGADPEEETTPANKTRAQWRTWMLDDALPRHLGGYGGCTSEAEAFRLYNARDADATFQIWYPLRTLLDKYALDRLYHHVSVPIAKLCQEMNERGLAVDHSALETIRKELEREIEEIDATLPAPLRSRREPIMARVRLPEPRIELVDPVCTGTKDVPHEPVTIPGGGACPRCWRQLSPRKRRVLTEMRQVGERVIYPWNSAEVLREYAASLGLSPQLHPKTKRPTADKNARKVWARRHPEFYTVDVLKAKKTLMQSFAKPGLLQTDRMYFQLLPHGTATGRLACKALRRGIDLNVQNIPAEMKRLFVPDPGYVFVKADVSQGENILTALLAGDHERLKRLSDPDFDEHSWTATACFGVPVTRTNENRHLRQAGKRINHMLNYGASWKKLREVMLIDGFDLSPAECREIIERWREANAATAEWQDRTVELATKRGYLVNPFGRRRWFQTKDIGPKALAFLPSSTLADCVFRMMIALHYSRFMEHVHALGLERYTDLPEGAYLAIQVHDELVVAAPADRAEETLERLVYVMTQPWKELGGYAFRVDAKICKNSLRE